MFRHHAVSETRMVELLRGKKHVRRSQLCFPLFHLDLTQFKTLPYAPFDTRRWVHMAHALGVSFFP